MLVAAPDDRRVFGANLEGGSVSVIDRGRETVGTVPLTPGQIGIDVSPDALEVWSASFQSNEIAVIDATSGSVLMRLADLVPSPGRLRFTPDGQRVLIVYGGSEPGVAMVGQHSHQLGGEDSPTE